MERERITSPLYVPPKPSCRRPLSRMVIDEAPTTLAGRHSSSLKPSSNTSHQQIMSEQPEISSDDNDDENEKEGDSNEEDTKRLYPTQHMDHERQRFSSTKYNIYRANSPKLIAEAAIKKPHRKSTDLYESDSTGQVQKLLESSGRNSTEGTSSNIPLGKYFCRAIFIAVIGIVFWRYTRDSAANSHSLGQDRPSIESEHFEQIRHFKNNIRDIRKRFPGQNLRTWGEIESGIIDVIKQSQKPWIFVLFSNETKELSCLAKLLGKASSKALHSDVLELYPKDMGDDYGLAIDRLGPEITAKRTVVVHDLLNINPRAIQAFHTMCDRENPLVEGAVYILTVITPGNVPEFEKPVKFVEDQLTNRFINKVPKDKLQPLITRLTDGPIIPVKSEISLTGCPF